jgi:hypothetical protein
MLRISMMALLVLLGTTTALAAETPSDLAAGGGILGARQQSTAVIGKGRRSLRALPTAQLRLGRAVAQSIVRAEARQVRGGISGPTAPATALAAAPPKAPTRQLAWLNLSGGNRPTFAYALNDALSLGLGYRFVTGETMKFEVAKTGSMSPDYASHNVLLRAHFQF